MLTHAFMQRAFIVGIMLSIIIPMIGVVMVNRKTSMIGDALSHTALAGVGFGLILGLNPIYGSLVICILAAFAIEFIRKKFPQYGDMATAIIMSTGLGLAAILSDFAPGGSSFESYLFGSISTVSQADVYMISLVFISVMILSLFFYQGLLFISIDPFMSKLAGVKVVLINSIFTFLAAITVATSTKIVGALMVSSLIVLPVTSSLIVSRSYKMTYIFSVIFGIIFVSCGIIISYYFGLKPGGAIVLIAVVGLIIISILKYLILKIIRIRTRR